MALDGAVVIRPALFPSPHSGILFLSERMVFMLPKFKLFPSPHSGILFLCEKELADYSAGLRMFPSPHSGILFL